MRKDYFSLRLMGIIGHPLGHSLSPLLHNSMFERLGVMASYHPWPTPPERLADFVSAFRTLPIHGCSVTIPHKEAIMPLCDRLTEQAEAVGAVNTLFWDESALVGDNTDVAGFTAPLNALGRIPESALVLGAGGAARAAVWGLRSLGVGRIGVANRTHERSTSLCGALGGEPVAWENRADWGAGLVVNTTPLGMAGKSENGSPWPRSSFSPDMIAYDMVYNPVRTRFLAEAQAVGCGTISGLDMFVHQAAAQFRLWTGLDMDIPFARQVCLSALPAS